jgi:hypothetical protein
MSEPGSSSASLCWCQVPVPHELETELLCVQHFLLGIEHDCAELRRETAQGRSSSIRQSEIVAYVKTTAMKLTQVATGRLRLTDDQLSYADEPSGKPRSRCESHPGNARTTNRICTWLVLAGHFPVRVMQNSATAGLPVYWDHAGFPKVTYSTYLIAAVMESAYALTTRIVPSETDPR